VSLAVAAGVDSRPQLADLLSRTKSMTGSRTVSLICKGSRANLPRLGAATHGSASGPRRAGRTESQDDTLIAYAHEFCGEGPVLPSGGALFGQGVMPGQLYQVKVAASRVYCPDKIALPAQPPNVYHGGNL
jgi:hypothetical protein